MHFRLLLISLLCLVFQNIKGQKYIWEGTLSDSETSKIISNASLAQENSNFGLISNSKGEFKIKFDNCQNSFVISHLSYKVKYVDWSPSDFKKQVNASGEIEYYLKRNIQLDPRSINIGNVQVYASPNPPDTIYGIEQYNVGDFAFLNDGHSLLMAYEKEKRWKREGESKKSLYSGCRLILLDGNNKELDSYSMGDQVCESLYTEFLGEVFLKTKSQYFLIKIINSDITLESIKTSDFEEIIKPVVDTIGDLVYLSSYAEDYPAFEYYVFNKKDSTVRTLQWIVDQPLMDLFRSEYKYMDGRSKLEAYRYELKTGIEKEIVAAYMTGFTNDIYYQSLYAPIFIHDDTITVFDHYEDKMITYDSKNNSIDSTLISYHKTGRKKEWQDQMIQDEVSGEIYAIFLKNGYYYLKQINKQTGMVENPFKLFYKFSENIKVKNGYVYYIYRPFESSQKKFLYRERILKSS